MIPGRAGPALLLFVLATACARGAAESRPQWLQRTLLARDQDALVRGDAERVKGKYTRMARDTFSYYRGTSWLLPREPSRFESAASAKVAVIGDPHPENVGTFLAGSGARVVDFNDFDLAGHGRYIDDLRRLALSLWIAGDMADVKKKQRGKVVGHTVEGYLAELRALARGGPGISLRVETAFGGDLEDVLVGVDDDETGESVTREEEALVRALLARYPATLHEPKKFSRAMFAPKRILRRHLGVGSFPVVRFRAVVEGPTAAPGDDWTLELKESAAPGAGQRPSAAAIVAIQRQFQEFPDDDPLLGWAAEGKREFRVRRVSADQRRLDVERIVKQLKSPRWGKRDLKDFAFQLGRLLARGHGRALAADGQPGAAAITAAVGDGAGLHHETASYVARVARQTEEDLAHFRALLKQHGPLLGWRAR